MKLPICAFDAKKNPEIDRFSISSIKEIQGSYVIYLSKQVIFAIRKSRTLYKKIQDELPGRVLQIVKNLRDLDIEIEFEDSRR